MGKRESGDLRFFAIFVETNILIMKNLLFVLLALMPILSFGQTKEEHSKTKTSSFINREGSLEKKEFFHIDDGEIKGLGFFVIVYTDLNTSEKIACLQVTSAQYSYVTKQIETSVGILDSDEVEKCLQSLIYIKNKIIINKASIDSEIYYNSRDLIRIGVSTNNKAEWIPFLRLDRWSNIPVVLLKLEQLDVLILNFEKAQKQIKESLSIN